MNNLHSLGQSRLDGFNPLLDALDYIKCVDSVTRYNYTAHCFFAVLVQHTSAERIAKFHVRNVAYIDGGTVR